MGLGDFVSNMFGSKNEEKATAPKVDPNAYQYGGYEGGADEAAGRYARAAAAAQKRTGAHADYTEANQDRANATAAREGQLQATQLMMSRATGRAPSIAQMQADRQMQQATAAQASAAASARGPAALALAQQNAANQTANAQGQISGQAQINAANERLQAEQAAFAAASGMRGQDIGMRGQSAQMAQYNSTNDMQQRELNDRMTLGMTQSEMGVRGMQLGASQNQQAQQSSNQLGAAGINAGVGGQNAAMNQQNAMGLVGMGTSFAGGLAGGGGGGGSVTGKAAGGGVALGRPYLVGEKGPELVVPTAPGHVIPADQTRKLLGRAEGGPVVPFLAPSTWGTTGPAVEDQQLAAAQTQREGEAAQAAYQQAVERVDPYQRDLDQVRTLRAITPSLVDEDDQRRERVARAKLRLSKGDASKAKDDDGEERAAVAEGKAVPEKPSLRSRLSGAVSSAGDKLQAQAGRVDTGYHGPTSFAGPNLIPVTPRAMGGPIGGLVPLGTAGGAMSPMSGAAAPSFDVLNGGGMDVVGSLRAHSNFGTKFQRDPSAGMMARASGGPMEPEVYVPVFGTPEADRLRIGDDDRAFIAPSEQRDSRKASLASALAPAEQAPLAARIPVGGSQARKKSPEELLREAEAMMGQMQAEHAAYTKRGPAVAPREDGGPIEPGSEAGKLREAYLLGRAHEMEKNPEFAYGGAPTAKDEIVDRDPMHSAQPPSRHAPVYTGPSVSVPLLPLLGAMMGPIGGAAVGGAEMGKRVSDEAERSPGGLFSRAVNYIRGGS